PELVRCAAGGVGELVHERLDREDVGERAEAAGRGRADRGAADEMAGNTLDADFVQRIGVAVRTAVEATASARAGPAPRPRPRPRGEEPGVLRSHREGTGDVGVAVGVVIP